MIIGISGKINAGKDSLCAIIQELDEAWENKKFAYKLKATASLLTGVPIEKFEDRDFKNSYMGDQWGMTYREFLQKLGTEGLRNGVHTNTWVNALFADYKAIIDVTDLEKAKMTVEEAVEAFRRGALTERVPIIRIQKWVITDVRFPNEAQAVLDHGGVLVRINRSNNEVIPSNHPSETSLDDWTKWNYVYDNCGTYQDLQEFAGRVLSGL